MIRSAWSETDEWTLSFATVVAQKMRALCAEDDGSVSLRSHHDETYPFLAYKSRNQQGNRATNTFIAHTLPPICQIDETQIARSQYDNLCTFSRCGVPAPLASDCVNHRRCLLDHVFFSPNNRVCLLYTSDAADEEDSVDLGGRRI